RHMDNSLTVPRLLAGLILAACWGFFAPSVIEQPAGAQGENFLYRVMKDDTLMMLSDRFTDSTERWRTLQTLNTIDDPTGLPIGLELKIPFALIPEQAA